MSTFLTFVLIFLCWVIVTSVPWVAKGLWKMRHGHRLARSWNRQRR